MSRKIRITLTGLRPLLLKRSFWEHVKSLATESPVPMPQEITLEDEIYRDPHGQLALPRSLILDVLNHQAAKADLIPHRRSEQDLRITEEWIPLLDPATGQEAKVELHTEPYFRRNANGPHQIQATDKKTGAVIPGKFIRGQHVDFTAAAIEQWQLIFTLGFQDLEPTKVIEAITDAGKCSGFGCNQKKGFGSFDVTHWEEVA